MFRPLQVIKLAVDNETFYDQGEGFFTESVDPPHVGSTPKDAYIANRAALTKTTRGDIEGLISESESILAAIQANGPEYGDQVAKDTAASKFKSEVDRIAFSFARNSANYDPAAMADAEAQAGLGSTLTPDEMGFAMASNAIASVEQMVRDKTTSEQLAQATLMSMGQTKSPVLKNAMVTDYLRGKQAELIGEDPSYIWDTAKVMLVPFNTSGTVLNYDGDYTNDLAEFRSLTLEDKIARSDYYFRKIKDAAGDNSVLAQQLSEPFVLWGDKEAEDELIINASTDVLSLPDLLSLGAGAAVATRTLSRTKKLSGVAEVLKNSGHKKEAGELLGEVATGNERAEVVAGADRMDAIDAANPFTASKPSTIRKALAGLSAETQRGIARKTDRVRKIMQLSTDSETTLGILGPITDKEQIAAANARILEQYAGKAEITKQLPNGVELKITIENPAFSKSIPEMETQISTLEAKVMERRAVLQKSRAELGEADYATSDFVKGELKEKFALESEIEKLKKQIKQAEKGPTLSRTQTYRYTADEVTGTLRATEVEGALTPVNSPEVWANQLEDNIVQTASGLEIQKGTIARELRLAAEETWSGLSAKQRKNVSDLLLRGDREGKVYTGREAHDLGLESPAEKGAYFAARVQLDELHKLKDRMIAREKEFNGEMRLILKGVDGEDITTYARRIRQESIPQGVGRFYDGQVGGLVDTTDVASTIAKRIGKGWRFVKFDKGVSFGDETVNWGLVKEAHLKPIGGKGVLNYRTGYTPLIRKDVFYAVRTITKRKVDGYTVDNWKSTVRLFGNKQEADDWAATQEALTGVKHESKASRELQTEDPDFREVIDEHHFGGVFRGSRKEAPLPYGSGDGLHEAERISAPEALERYINHVASAMPISEWRLGVVKRFLNSAQEYLEDPTDWLSPLKLPKGDKKQKALEAYRSWIESQLDLQGTEDRLWANATRTIAEWMDPYVLKHDGKVRGRAVDALRLRLLRTSSKPALFARIKSITNHVYLGGLNLAQMPVQMLNVQIVLSLHGTKAVSAMAKWPALRWGMYLKRDPEAWAEFAKAANINPTHFKTMMKAYHKSGIVDSVWTNADIEASRHGFSATARGFDNLKNTSMFIYRESELFNRSISWMVAYEEAMAKKGAGAVLNDMELRSVMDQMHKYTLNLSRPNAAMWQHGLLGVMTQYAQVGAKYLENLLPKGFGGTGNWTNAEKARVFMGSIAMFGSVGLPFGTWIQQNVTSYLNETQNPMMMTPEGRAFFKGGLTEALFQYFTGASPDLANRTSLMAATSDLAKVVMDPIEVVFGTADGGTKAAFLGAFGGLFHRVTDSWHVLSPLIFSTSPMEHTQETFKQALWGVGELFSSARNAHKAYLWETAGYMFNPNTGQRYMPLDPDHGDWQLFYQKIGMTPREMADYYALKEENFKRDDRIKLAVDMAYAAAQRYATNSDLHFDDKYRRFAAAQIDIILEGLDPGEREEAGRLFVERLKQRDYALTREILKSIEHINRTGDTEGYEGNVHLDPSTPLPPKED